MPKYTFQTVAEFSQHIRRTAHENRIRSENISRVTREDAEKFGNYIGAAAALETLAAIVEQSNLTVKV